MKKKIFLFLTVFLFLFFTVMFAAGVLCMNCEILNINVCFTLTLIGIIGIGVLGLKYMYS